MFQYGVLSKQSRDFSKGQEARANVEHPFVAGHLNGSVGLASGRWEQQHTFHLIHFVQHIVKSDCDPKSAW